MAKSREHTAQKSGVVYRSLVASLFEDVQILALSVLCSAAAVLMTAHKTNSLILYLIAGMVVLLGLVRIYWTRAFQKAAPYRELTNAAARQWEHRFTIGAVGYALVFGAWFSVVSALNDHVSEVICSGIIMANVIGICCRSYPFIRLVTLQLICVFVPIVVSLMLAGGYFFGLALLLIPYAIGIRKIAMEFREKQLSNIFQRRKAEKMAEQFDTALNSVPHGICMYNRDGVLEVTNKHILSVTGRSEKSLIGNTAVQMIDILMHERDVSAQDCAVLLKWVTDPDRKYITHVFEMGENPRRSIKFRSKILDSGGIIATYEDVTSEVRAASRIDQITRFDSLTGLLNRDQFKVFLDQQLRMMRGSKDCAVLLVNLDNFKNINEFCGHRFGDLLICEVTKRLTAVCGDAAVCARYGGDEFAILVKGDDSVDMSLALADSIGFELAKPIEIEGRNEKVGCSIGIVNDRSDVDDVETLLKKADIALNTAKREGGGEWCVFNEDMGRDLHERRELEADLAKAVVRGELEAFFQPLVSVQHKKVTVCEALVRWNHPVHGYIPPFRFIPLAEELGLVGEIGEWMLRESCKACVTWPEDTRVAVNLSPLQFTVGNIVKTIRDILRETGLDATRLEIEVTESLMLEDMHSTIEKLQQLKSMGVRISLDDFGTGYSSLSYMNKLPLDKVKIDRSFVTGLQPNSKSLALVQAISTLGHQLGLSVVVEGIETQAELSTLLENVQVNEIQGYYFSRPVDGKSILDLLSKEHGANRKMLGLLEFSNVAA